MGVGNGGSAARSDGRWLHASGPSPACVPLPLMPNRRYLQLDVFASRPGTGNPLGVVLDAGWHGHRRDAGACGLAEPVRTIFFLPPGCRRRLPHPHLHARQRTALCRPSQRGRGMGGPGKRPGHAARRPAWSSNAGPACCRCGSSGDADAPRITRAQSAGAESCEALAAPLPAGLADIAQPGQAAMLWNNGPSWWLVEAASPELLRSFRPDFAAIAAWTDATAATGVAIFASEASDGHDIAVRAFCPGDADGIPEDPVTGSANALVAACSPSKAGCRMATAAMSPARAANLVATAASRCASTTKARSGSAGRCSR